MFTLNFFFTIFIFISTTTFVVADEAWSRGPPLVFAATSAVSVGSKVIFYNGNNGGRTKTLWHIYTTHLMEFSGVDIYDSLTDQWSVGPPLSTNRTTGG